MLNGPENHLHAKKGSSTITRLSEHEQFMDYESNDNEDEVEDDHVSLNACDDFRCRC